MSFNRNRTQVRCEAFPGCNPAHDQKMARKNFESYRLSSTDALNLKSDLDKDALDFYYKGILSFVQACAGVQNNLYSWATVQLYYSVYYLLRCSLATKGVAVVRIGSLWNLRARQNETPDKRSGKKYNTTHKGTIFIYKQLFKNSDILQDNQVKGEDGYLWLLECRERVSYREREFYDPSSPRFWSKIAEDKDRVGLDSVLSKYMNDSFVYCFQGDHACLAFPVKRLLLTRKDMIDAGITLSFSDEKVKFLSSIISSSSIPSLNKVSINL